MLDLFLGAFAIMVMVTGWQRGFLVSTVSLVGVGCGLAVARAVITTVEFPATSIPTSEFIWITGVLFGAVIIGSAFGAFVGREVRSGINIRPIVFLDSLGGSVFSLLAWSIVVWFLASTFAVSPISNVTHILAESKVIATLDGKMPNDVRAGVSRLQIYVSVSKLPALAIDIPSIITLPEPNPAITDDPEVLSALTSVLRVEGVSRKCKVSTSGSGFVVAKHVVMTNAHVVAGTSHVGVRVKGKGEQLDGTVVYFNPNLDIALIRVNKLKSASLDIVTDVGSGKSAVVAGFPGGGGLELIPATVSASVRSRGTDIYGKDLVVRQIYTIKADIQHGDSGAGLLTDTGEVAGIVFAASASDSSVGYALSPTEFTGVIAKSATLSDQVDTGKCLPK